MPWKDWTQARPAHIRETPSSTVPCLVSGAYSGIIWVPIDLGSPISTPLLPVAHMGLYPDLASLGTCSFPQLMPPQVHHELHEQPSKALHTPSYTLSDLIGFLEPLRMSTVV